MMTVFRTATLRTFFFAIHAGAKELKQHHTLSSLFRKPEDAINFEQSMVWCIKFLAGIAMLCM